MSLSDTEALAEINITVENAWTAGVPSIAGSAGHSLRFKGKKEANPAGYWARVSADRIASPLASLADETTFGNNKKRYETTGVVFVQVYAPKSENNSFKKGLQIAEIVRDAFRSAGQAGSVWYEDARINDLPDDGSSWRWNVVATFRYDTIR